MRFARIGVIGVGVAASLITAVAPSPNPDEALTSWERNTLEYEETVPDTQSPGLYYPEGETQPVVRTFADVPDSAARSLSSGGDWEVERSQYTQDEVSALESLATSIPLVDDEYLSFSYHADEDVFVLRGSVSQSTVDDYLKGYRYRFEPTTGGGRMTRTSDPAPHRGVIDGVEVSALLGIETTAELDAFLASDEPKAVTVDVTTGEFTAVEPAAAGLVAPSIVTPTFATPETSA